MLQPGLLLLVAKGCMRRIRPDAVHTASIFVKVLHHFGLESGAGAIGLVIHDVKVREAPVTLPNFQHEPSPSILVFTVTSVGVGLYH